MSSKPKPLTPGLNLDQCHIVIAHNGYLVETEDEGPEGLQVFNNFADLVEFLFRNLVKPKELIEH